MLVDKMLELGADDIRFTVRNYLLIPQRRAT
jgi:hypothetical protein